ncbi:DedA family protein [Paraphotobacterium marinum]|uniref:DedA family protein n=1 Tax=Paraphotobacterium marinum TaxID=1755811 RepID=A0A220VEF5_9GAMM|nr:DedA family protein [Paraphotobacterium marinum]ASK78737.1 DedA family protein [Paraphotobacterium marinum]
MSSIHSLIEAAGPFVNEYGYLAVAVAVFAEGFAIPLPGTTVLVTASIIAASTTQLSLPIVLVIAFIAAILGNTIGYYIGIYFKNFLISKNLIKDKKLDKLHNLLSKYGIIAIIISRFIEGLKQTINIGCGVANMSKVKYQTGNITAVSLWVIVFGLFPSFVTKESKVLLTFYNNHQAFTLFSLFIVLTLLIFIVYKIKKKNANKPK